MSPSNTDNNIFNTPIIRLEELIQNENRRSHQSGSAYLIA